MRRRHFMFAVAFPVYSEATCPEDVSYEDIRRGIEKRLDYLFRHPDELIQAAGWFTDEDEAADAPVAYA